MTIKKTSDVWAKELCVLIMDEDGWDRQNFEYSWFKEEITEEEFIRRKALSTVLMEAKAPKGYKLITFRTEGPNDEKRVDLLLKLMGWKPCFLCKVKDPEVASWYHYQYTMAVPEASKLEVHRGRMEEFIDNDDRLVDMHRCHQTLADGKFPDDEWYKRDLPEGFVAPDPKETIEALRKKMNIKKE